MNPYEIKQDDRRERLLRAAEKAEQLSEARFQAARSAVAGIPLGQPILVDHYSANRHRAALKRQDSAMRRGVELAEKAKKLRAMAAGVGDGGISSDDPDAVEKLTDKRTDLEIERDLMKSANAYYKARKTLAGWLLTDPVALAAPSELANHVLQTGVSTLRVQPFYNRPFPTYALSNIGARIRDAAKRADRLVQRQAEVEEREAEGRAIETEQIGAATLTIDYPENRVVVAWPTRLTDAQYKTVRHHGFIWSPTRKGFLRKLGGRGTVEYARACIAAVAKLAPPVATPAQAAS